MLRGFGACRGTANGNEHEESKDSEEAKNSDDPWLFFASSLSFAVFVLNDGA
jgi:hypothetical protein